MRQTVLSILRTWWQLPIVRRRQPRARYQAEAIEPRILMAASPLTVARRGIELQDGTLSIHASSHTEKYEVRSTGTRLDVVADGRVARVFYLNQVREIRFEGSSSDDRLDASRLNVAIPLMANGGNGDDILIGGLGSNQLWGGNGNDHLVGQFANDTIEGQSGDDTIQGGAGNDILRGGDGSDFVVGDSGADSLNGDGGNDQLLGGSGDDYLEGAAGADTLNGGSGNDSLYGNADNDVLTAGTGRNSLSGGSGNDIFNHGNQDQVTTDSEDSINQQSGSDGQQTLIPGVSFFDKHTDPNFNPQTGIGLSIDRFREEAARHGFKVRQAIIDGRGQMLTMDFRSDRINVETRNSIVVRIVNVG